ncbi:MAG: class I SAM-dependent methyltransferase [Acidimicrobiales bacterium]|nr:class I SAM-dependent methyltransferase [Acidimicrobiales bacterium]MCB9392717.1 class I SAM-dependent methyltransferase [Acidimicrobiaceae bacterium]
MGLVTWYERRVLPRAIDIACGSSGFRQFRADTVAGTHGTVLEIGFGSGHNLAHYPDAVDRLLAVDPSGRALEIATPRIERSRVSVELVGLDGQQIPLDDASVDCVVSTFTLCTIPDVQAALHEVRRVLKPGGTFHVLEHGLADDPGVQRWQRRWNPIQRRIAGGCHTDRHVPGMLSDAGFTWAPDALSRGYAGRPKLLAHLTQVTARVV